MKTGRIDYSRSFQLFIHIHSTLVLFIESLLFYISSQLPDSVKLEHVLSREISKILRIPFVLPLAPILTCKSSDIMKTLHLLQMATGSENSSRGVPGALLTPQDKQIIKFSPLHCFFVNEIVAFSDPENNLRYGIVMNNRSSTTDLEKIPVKVSAHETQLLPTTKIYVFKSQKAEKSKDVNNNNEKDEVKVEENAPAKSLPVSEREYMDAVKDLLQKVSIKQPKRCSRRYAVFATMSQTPHIFANNVFEWFCLWLYTFLWIWIKKG